MSGSCYSGGKILIFSLLRKDESPQIVTKSEKKRKHRNYRKEKHKDADFSDISDEEGGGSKNKAVSKYASVASSFIEAVESATIKGKAGCVLWRLPFSLLRYRTYLNSSSIAAERL